MAETIQKLILETLEKHGTIRDTRTLVLPGHTDPAATHDAQIIILGALNSLSSRDVS
jgi:phenylalanyl-tRNA synthetase alpha chain